MTWGTSPAFLDHFGLTDITDLPGMDDLRAAGLLRKGQILGALIEDETAHDIDVDVEKDDLGYFDGDFLTDEATETGSDGEVDA